jgi:hypothetical protein
VTAWSKASVFSCSLAGFIGSNPVGGMHVCLLRVVGVVRYRNLSRADHPSRAVLSSEVCLSVIMKPRK